MLAQYRELEAFAQFASDLDEATRKQLERGERSMEILKQAQYEPMSVAQMSLTLYAVNKGYLDDIPAAEVEAFDAALQAYAATHAQELMNKINEKGDFNETIDQGLAETIKTFKSNGTW